MHSLQAESLRSLLFSGMSSWQKTEFAVFPVAPDNRYPHQAALLCQQACQRPGEEAQVIDPGQSSPR